MRVFYKMSFFMIGTHTRGLKLANQLGGVNEADGRSEKGGTRGEGSG